MTAVGRVLWLDPLGGLAGDMFCAALLNAGADLDLLRAQLASLGLSGWSVNVEQVHRGAFAATRFDVRIDHSTEFQPSAGGNAHSHSHSHSHSPNHSHDHIAAVGPHPEAAHGQPDRSWSTIQRLLQGADLPSRARTRALAVFSALAHAESRVHGVPPDDVIFHEVGALDSLIDVVGSCLLLEQLDVSELWCASLPIASGRTTGAHGTIPLPAPATAVLLEGWPVHPGQPDQEQVTPTGAALVAALARPGPPPAMVMDATGMGAGARDLPHQANVLRVLLGRPAAGITPARQIELDAGLSATPASDPAPLDVEIVSATMDDFMGEHLPSLFDALHAAGAIDAWANPVLMKKGRSGLTVQALAKPHHADAVGLALLRHGSTFGVRRSSARRQVLARYHVRVQTAYGPVRIKVGHLDDDIIHAAPEHEDLAACARISHEPIPRVYAAALAAWQESQS